MWIRRLRYWLESAGRSESLRGEMELHLAEKAAELEADGMTAERARAGKGPALIELATYRRSGHAHHDDDRFHGQKEQGIAGYELDDERAQWEKADPVELYERRLLEEGVLSRRDVESVRKEVAQIVRDAAAKVEQAAWPEPAPQVVPWRQSDRRLA